jgi:hypothetical protein
MAQPTQEWVLSIPLSGALLQHYPRDNQLVIDPA